MAVLLKQSTQVDVRIGPFVDVGDGFTPETGVALSTADEAELLKADGAATVDISGATWAAVTGADGWYDLTLTTSHTDTVGELVVVVQDDSVCLPVFQRFQVVEEATYDFLYASGATPVADINAECDTALSDYDAATGTELAAVDTKIDTIDTVVDGIQSDLDNGTDGLGAIKADTAAILTDTAEIGAAGAGLTEAGGTGDHLTAVPWNAAWDAEVESEATDALNAYDPPTKAELDSGFAGQNDVSTAQVNAEVADVLKTDTISEMAQQAPPATPTFEEAVMYLYMALRNAINVDTSGTDYKEFTNDAGIVIWKKQLADDGTTYTESEGETGP